MQLKNIFSSVWENREKNNIILEAVKKQLLFFLIQKTKYYLERFNIKYSYLHSNNI